MNENIYVLNNVYVMDERYGSTVVASSQRSRCEEQIPHSRVVNE